VAYDTLSRRDRVGLHETVAAHLRATFPDDGAEVAEVIAAHYADALELASDAADRDRLRALALSTYVRAGRRSMAIGAPETAIATYLAAAELATSEEERATLIGEAGLAAYQGGRADVAIEHLEIAIAAHEADGRLLDAAGLMTELSRAMIDQGRVNEATDRLAAALAAIDNAGPDARLCAMAAQLAAGLATLGRHDEAAAYLDRALIDAQALNLTKVLASAFQTKASLLLAADRHVEALFAMDAAVTLAHDSDLGYEEGNAHAGAAIIRQVSGLPDVEAHTNAALAIARRRGDRAFEAVCLSNVNVSLMNEGRWDEISAPVVHPEGLMLGEWLTLALLAIVAARRGEDPTSYLDPILGYIDSENPERVAGVLMAKAEVELLQGDARAALADGRQALELSYRRMGARGIDYTLHLAFAAALELGDMDEAERLQAFVDELPEENLSPDGRAYRLHYRARLNAARGKNDTCDGDFLAAIEIISTMGVVYEVAEMRVPYASWLASQDRIDDAVAQASLAAETFEQLRVAPGLEQVRTLLNTLAPTSAAIGG
jgi:tetratricopeptide (TPR) repeat protein